VFDILSLQGRLQTIRFFPPLHLLLRISINSLLLPIKKVSKERPTMVTPIRGSTLARPIFSRMGVAPPNRVVAINKKTTSPYLSDKDRLRTALILCTIE
jgi:hypothetical protein